MPGVVNENLSTEFGKHYGSRDAAEKSNLKKRNERCSSFFRFPQIHSIFHFLF